MTEILHKQERRLGTVEMKAEGPKAPVALAWEHCSSADLKDNLPEDKDVHRRVQNKYKPPKGCLEVLGPTKNTEKQTRHAEASATSTGLCPIEWLVLQVHGVSGQQSHQRGRDLLKHFCKMAEDLKC